MAIGRGGVGGDVVVEFLVIEVISLNRFLLGHFGLEEEVFIVDLGGRDDELVGIGVGVFRWENWGGGKVPLGRGIL